jgi:hypothetical protein
MASSDGRHAHSAEPVLRVVPGAVVEREPGLGQRPGDCAGKRAGNGSPELAVSPDLGNDSQPW